jgi:hypothetical protein
VEYVKLFLTLLFFGAAIGGVVVLLLVGMGRAVDRSKHYGMPAAPEPEPPRYRLADDVRIDMRHVIEQAEREA